VHVCKTEFWVIQQNRKYLLDSTSALETCLNTTSAQGSCLKNTTSGLPTSGPHPTYKPDTVTRPNGKSPPTSYTPPGTGSLTSSTARYPLVQPDLRPVMGNGASSSQGGLPTYDQRDVGSSVEEEQHDWQPEQAVASQP